jgi:hypothetical protein
MQFLSQLVKGFFTEGGWSGIRPKIYNNGTGGIAHTSFSLNNQPFGTGSANRKQVGGRMMGMRC